MPRESAEPESGPYDELLDSLLSEAEEERRSRRPWREWARFELAKYGRSAQFVIGTMAALSAILAFLLAYLPVPPGPFLPVIFVAGVVGVVSALLFLYAKAFEADKVAWRFRVQGLADKDPLLVPVRLERALVSVESFELDVRFLGYTNLDGELTIRLPLESMEDRVFLVQATHPDFTDPPIYTRGSLPLIGEPLLGSYLVRLKEGHLSVVSPYRWVPDVFGVNLTPEEEMQMLHSGGIPPRLHSSYCWLVPHGLGLSSAKVSPGLVVFRREDETITLQLSLTSPKEISDLFVVMAGEAPVASDEKDKQVGKYVATWLLDLRLDGDREPFQSYYWAYFGVKYSDGGFELKAVPILIAFSPTNRGYS